MTDESTIQCETCGTLYSDIEEVCPYCGEPQPSLHHEEYAEDEFMLEPDEHEFVEDDYYLPTTDEPLPDEPLYEDELHPDEAEDEPYLEEEIVPSRASEQRAYTPPLEDEPVYADDFGDESVVYDDVDGAYDDEAEAYEDYYDDEAEFDEEVTPRRFGWRRMTLGCLGLLFCIGAFYGSIGVFAAYRGLQERTTDIELEARTHYERGQTEIANGNLERGVAEFEQAIKLNPSLLPAREALREARAVIDSQPTPTSETRLAAAAELLEQAEAEVDDENWVDALESLSEIRDLDPDFEPELISDLLFQANYELGRAAIDPDTMLEALTYFEQALAEAPDDAEAQVEQVKAALYVDGLTALDAGEADAAVDAFNQLYREDDSYLDVEALLIRSYERLGDELVAEEEWCLAEIQYIEASDLKPSDNLLQRKAEDSNEQCEASPAPRPARVATPQNSAASSSSDDDDDPNGEAAGGAAANNADPDEAADETETSSSSAATPAGGTIYYSLYNTSETEWQILAIPADGSGSSKVVVTEGTMPAVSPNGQLLVYRAEAIEAEGFHVYDMTTGEDQRITDLRQDILPRWGGNNAWFIFVAQEPATSRWRIQQGFADGRGDSQILRDGRTPDLSPDDNLIAYQGTDAEGNNPGIYVVPFGGGNASRLTTHESDRAPDFSPNGNQIAYMSTQSGSWDIYVVNLDGGTPRRLTTTSSNDGLPVWSPDGSKIAYVSDNGGRWGIYVVGTGGGEPRQVTGWDGNQRENWLLSQIEWAR